MNTVFKINCTRWGRHRAHTWYRSHFSKYCHNEEATLLSNAQCHERYSEESRCLCLYVPWVISNDFPVASSEQHMTFNLAIFPHKLGVLRHSAPRARLISWFALRSSFRTAVFISAIVDCLRRTKRETDLTVHNTLHKRTQKASSSINNTFSGVVAGLLQAPRMLESSHRVNVQVDYKK